LEWVEQDGHLDESQRAMVAATEASRKVEGRRLGQPTVLAGVGDFLSVLEAQESLYSSDTEPRWCER
jgi:hypothetical protein